MWNQIFTKSFIKIYCEIGSSIEFINRHGIFTLSNLKRQLES